MDERLPEGWVWTTLGSIAEINPGVDIFSLPESMLVSFVPMAAVEANTGRMDSSQTRRLAEVKKGYTAFQENDILFAKITPCMENGKFSVAQSLVSGIGFGSTEFHILRAEKEINPYLLYYYLSQESFRQLAKVAMTGSAGQLRVPSTFLVNVPFPLAPTNEQARIVAAIERQFAHLDRAVASLKSAQAKIPQYRASLLKSAVEGELTREWRAAHPAEESGADLLKRILAERRARWEEAQLAKMHARGETPWNDEWKKAYKEPQGPDVENLPVLPEGWCWATVEQVSYFVKYGTSAKTSRDSSGVPVLRMGNLQDGILDFSNLKYLPADHPEFPELLLEKGDLLFNRSNSAELVGKSAIYRGEFPQCSYASYLICVRLLMSQLVDFLCFYINSHYGRVWVKSVYTQQAGQANVNGSKLQAMAFPVPPLAEQAQIVAEVEARLSEIAKMEEVIEHSLRRAELERQSILREAFAGRLVEQNPEDEPASVLLERIREERRRREALEKERRKGERTMRKGEFVYKSTEAKLYHTLAEARAPMEPGELFRQTGFKIDTEMDEPEPAEQFFTGVDYLASAGAIEEERPDNRTVLLKTTNLPEEQVQALLESAEQRVANQSPQPEQAELWNQ